MANNISGTNTSTDNLFASLAEQVKLPFTQIKYAAEILSQSDDQDKEKLINTISQASTSALSLIDSYLLNIELGRQAHLELEPVSMSSMMYDVAQSLDAFAKLQNCRLEINISGKYGPVMANNRAVFSAFRALGYSFIEAVSSSSKITTISLSVSKTPKGINTGIFADIDLSSSLLNQARELKGKAHQPFINFDSGPGAGIFLADELMIKMNSEIRVTKVGGLNGLAAVLRPSNQLSLV